MVWFLLHNWFKLVPTELHIVPKLLWTACNILEHFLNILYTRCINIPIDSWCIVPSWSPHGSCIQSGYSSGPGTSQLCTWTDIPCLTISFKNTPYLPSPQLNSSGWMYPWQGFYAPCLHAIEGAPLVNHMFHNLIHSAALGNLVKTPAGPLVMLYHLEDPWLRILRQIAREESSFIAVGTQVWIRSCGR